MGPNVRYLLGAGLAVKLTGSDLHAHCPVQDTARKGKLGWLAPAPHVLFVAGSVNPAQEIRYPSVELVVFRKTTYLSGHR